MIDTFLSQITNPRTRQTYEKGLAVFTDWYDKEISQLTVSQLKAYRKHLAENYSATTTNVYLSALRAYIRWLADEGLVDPSVYHSCAIVKNQKQQEVLPQALTEQQTLELLSKQDTSTECGARDYALILLLLSSGLRIGEVASIQIEQINWIAKELIVCGKGSKERKVFFNHQTAQALVWYLGFRNNPAEGQLFNVSIRQLQKDLEHYGVHPHQLRHTFATSFLDATGDLDATRRLLGHSSSQTTLRYTGLATKRLRKLYDAALECEVLELGKEKISEEAHVLRGAREVCQR